MWLFFLAFSLFMMYISPYVIWPLFTSNLRLLKMRRWKTYKRFNEKASIKVSRVFKMDASKRSKHTKCIFFRYWKSKRIVLYDTLLQIMNKMRFFLSWRMRPLTEEKTCSENACYHREPLIHRDIHIFLHIIKTGILGRLF